MKSFTVSPSFWVMWRKSLSTSIQLPISSLVRRACVALSMVSFASSSIPEVPVLASDRLAATATPLLSTHSVQLLCSGLVANHLTSTLGRSLRRNPLVGPSPFRGLSMGGALVVGSPLADQVIGGGNIPQATSMKLP